MQGRVVEVEAPAKVNLRLRVLAQETGGYHALESLFCAISLGDSLRMRPDGADIRLVVEGGVEVGPDEDNLVFRAARRFYLELGAVERGIRIELRKRVPSAAGLGGGSSDAAATLLGLNALHDDVFPRERLLQMAVELGSDVPFFLCGSTLALGWSRGERLLALPPLPPRPVLIAHPGVPMPTGQAFQRIAELRGGGYRPRAFAFALDALSSWATVSALAQNDFQEVALEHLPELGAALHAMLHAGAHIALLSGSGAALFGVFPGDRQVRAAEQAVRALGMAVWTAETLSVAPAPRVFPASGAG